MLFSTKKSGISKEPSSPGKQGEELARQYLLKKGFKILEMNYRCTTGEVDLIVLAQKNLHFVEVKTRASKAYGDPEDSVTLTKQRRLSRAAIHYLNRNPDKLDLGRCFSVLVIENFPKAPEIRFYANAFEVVGEDY